MKKLASVLLIAGCMVIIMFSASILSFSKKNELVQTDAAIVLGAAAYGDKPSPVFEERIKHGIWLYEEGYVEKLIFTGGKAEEEDKAESEVAKTYTLDKGVPEEDILIETVSTSTEGNILYAKDIGEREGFKTYTLVSDPFHMKRASLLANRMDLRTYSSPTQTSAYQSIETEVPFFLRELFSLMGETVMYPVKTFTIEA